MLTYWCDGCGAELRPDDGSRFVVRIEAFAAAGPLEITGDDLARDHGEEIRRLLGQLKGRNPDEIEDAVYRRMCFDLCPPCHRRFLESPLAGLRPLTG
jgi:hypothetical protein